mmetsp:Transcript_40629/g.102071  ORF Transcript_40629/g.102071 Transcript_40629/m.102071 type:complete len:963 (+) Transcript_40629:123-3011(+)
MSQSHEDILQQEAFDQGTKVAQIFSGIFFSGLAAWLTVTNGTKLAFVQRAALEKRLTVCCFLNTYVGFFSAFFNFFQLTDVDDAVLPNSESFTLDLSRPIEWVMTCPIMQLVLVLMGGAKIPEYRRLLMPFFSVFILGCGTTSTFMPNVPLKAACWGVGFSMFCVMVYFNRMQIIEYSAGEEGLLQGDSEFRKATMLLISTWFPFPIWFLCSPEGFGFIDNVLIIQVGWAFLNIVSKFVFIFYIQRIKDLYCNRLKTKRELVGNGSKGAHAHRQGAVSPPIEDGFMGHVVPDYDSARAYEEAEQERKKSQLGAVIVETMSFLGMAQHTDRFLKLLDRAHITTVDEVEKLSKEQCADLSLPYDLVSALQRRLRVWKLEMVDDAEMGLDKGEEFYIKKGLELPKMDHTEAYPNNLPNMMPHPVPPVVQLHGMPQGMLSGQQTPNAGENGYSDNGYNTTVEELLQRTEQHILEGQESKVQAWQNKVSGLVAELQAMEKRLVGHIEATSKTAEQRAEFRAYESRLNLKFEEVAKTEDCRHDFNALERRLEQTFEQQLGMFTTRVDVCCQKVEAINQKVDACSQKIDTGVVRLSEKVDEVFSHTRSSLDMLAQNTETLKVDTRNLQASQTKLAADSEAAMKHRIEEFENALVVRDDDKEAQDKKRHDEVLKHSTAKMGELTTMITRMAERNDAATEGLGISVKGEVQAGLTRLVTKIDALQSCATNAARLQGEFESAFSLKLGEAVNSAVSQTAQQVASETAQRTEKAIEAFDGSMQKRFEQAVDKAVLASAQRGAAETALRAERAMEALDNGLSKKLDHAVGQAVAEGAQKGAAHTALRAEKAIESLENALCRRLDDAVSKAAADGMSMAATHTVQRMDKAIEGLEGSNRNELHAAVTNLAERIEDIQASQLRKTMEREDRTARRVEELLELSSNRSVQKVEDVGLDLKKELHGFAKRLNSKIPFM